MSTMIKPDTDTTIASRWWMYFSELGLAMDFDSQSSTDLLLRQLRQSVTTLEARVEELEAGTACSLETEPYELTERRVFHG